MMASETEIFNISGPLQLTAIDWKNFHHRKSVASSLVQGVYTLERDCQKKRQGPQAQAPPWWDFFNFKLIDLLEDDVDHSIFGAIYEFKSSAFNYYNSAQDAPKYVIAFRGTLIKLCSMFHDLKLDLMYIFNSLNRSSRFQQAMQYVQNMVTSAGAAKIWVAGHSLGSATALLMGKNMTKMGYPLETYLFNPPFISIPLEKLKNHKLKNGFKFARSVLKAGLTVAVKASLQMPLQNDSFVGLSAWVPFLFVNRDDLICSEYIGYFEDKKKMKDIGVEEIERLATENTFVSLVSCTLGSNSEPVHLLPSAHLTINQSPSPKFIQAHGFQQWWDSDLDSWSVLHQFYCNRIPNPHNQIPPFLLSQQPFPTPMPLLLPSNNPTDPVLYQFNYNQIPNTHNQTPPFFLSQQLFPTPTPLYVPSNNPADPVLHQFNYNQIPNPHNQTPPFLLSQQPFLTPTPLFPPSNNPTDLDSWSVLHLHQFNSN